MAMTQREGAAPAGATASVLEELASQFQTLGLNGSETRVLLSLLQLGSATLTQLANGSGIARSNLYPTLEELRDKGLVQAPPARGAAWTTPGWEPVMERLFAIHQRRLDAIRDAKDRALALARQLPEAGPDTALPWIHVLKGAAPVRDEYARLLSEARQEVLVFNQEPYAWSGAPNPAVLEAVGRGVAARGLYERSAVLDPAMEEWRAEREGYHAAGVEGRVVDDVPLKMAIFDRRVTLVTLNHPVLPEVGFPASLVVEHPRFAAMSAIAFEHLWAQGRPYEEVVLRPGRGNENSTAT